MQTLSNPDNVVLAGQVLDWAGVKTGQIRGLVFSVASLMAVIAVITAWWKTRSFVGTLVAFVLACLVLWGIGSLDTFKDKVGTEINGASFSEVHVAGDAPLTTGEGRRLV
ncbi:hypothetical protein [Streptomyces sp. NPDC096339]|uniref:hypothetical protein n=1 Tax=Streptomyces sp. NPDC096339 TaxID=3366086 RepID=UPI003815D6F1